MRALLRIVFPLVALLLASALPAHAQVMTGHLVGTYATAKEDCAKPEFEIRRGVIDGPGLHCIFGAVKDPAPGGTEAYEAKCTQKSEVHFGTLSFDLSTKDDHTRIMLPKNADWITLYPCK